MIGGGIARMRGALVVAEIALAVVLLSGAGLLIKSFVALQNVALGFRPENVLVMRANMAAAPPSVRQFFRDVMPQVAALPGVSAAGATTALPGHVQSMGPYFFDHMPPKVDLASAPSAAITIVAPGAFAALGIPLIAGRDFEDADMADRPPVAIVNEAMVRKSLPGENPIGRQVYCLYDSSQPMTIVGVTGDVRNRGPGPRPYGGVLHPVPATPLRSSQRCGANGWQTNGARGHITAAGARSFPECRHEVHDDGT